MIVTKPAGMPLAGPPSAGARATVWGLVLVAALAVSTTGFGQDSGTVLCPFRRCTGVACPGCGLTRAGGSLLRGDLVAANVHHPLVLPVLAQIVAGLVLWTVQPRTFWARHRRPVHVVLAINVVVMMLVWSGRLLG